MPTLKWTNSDRPALGSMATTTRFNDGSTGDTTTYEASSSVLLFEEDCEELTADLYLTALWDFEALYAVTAWSITGLYLTDSDDETCPSAPTLTQTRLLEIEWSANGTTWTSLYSAAGFALNDGVAVPAWTTVGEPDTCTARYVRAVVHFVSEVWNGEKNAITPAIRVGDFRVTGTPAPDVGSTVDLSVSVEAARTPVFAEESMEVTVTVTNAGTSTATGVVIGLTEPGAWTASTDPSEGTYAAGVWTVGELAPSQSETLTYTVSFAAVGAYDLVAQVTACDQTDVDSTPGSGGEFEDDFYRLTMVVIETDNPYVPDEGPDLCECTYTFPAGLTNSFTRSGAATCALTRPGAVAGTYSRGACGS